MYLLTYSWILSFSYADIFNSFTFTSSTHHLLSHDFSCELIINELPTLSLVGIAKRNRQTPPSKLQTLTQQQQHVSAEQNTNQTFDVCHFAPKKQ